MLIAEDKLSDFLSKYFLIQHSHLQSLASFPDSKISAQQPNYQTFAQWGLDLKQYKGPTSTYPKSIRDYGFTKKYEVVCALLPFVSNIRPQSIQTEILLLIINDVYNCYLLFIKNGLWKSKQYRSHLQVFFLLYLFEFYNLSETKTRKKFGPSYDKFLLNIFYTMNTLKSYNKYIKNFCNFLNASYSFGQLFLYLCLKNISTIQNCQEKVNSGPLKKILKIFQSSEDQSLHISISLSKDSINFQEDKLVGINSIFSQPIGSCLPLSKVKMYKIMKVCKIIVQQDEQQQEKEQFGCLTWHRFLKKYFEVFQQNTNQLCYEHIVSAQVVKCTYQLSKKLLADKCPQTQEQFMQEAFSYVFQILQLIFMENKPQVQDKKTLKNIESLRRHYSYMKVLSECSITVINKFTKKILKNNYILQLFKKYSEGQSF